MGKKFESRFGEGGYAGFSDGLTAEETATEDTTFIDQYSEGVSTKRWGVREMNS